MTERRDAHGVRFRATRHGIAAAIAGLSLAVLVALVVAPSGLFASASQNRAASLQATLQRGVAQLGVPGASAAVIQRGQPFWTGSAGTKVTGGTDAVTPRTLFITASTAKTVTAAMTLRLVDEGKLRLEQTVARYLPGLRDGRRITVR